VGEGMDREAAQGRADELVETALLLMTEDPARLWRAVELVERASDLAAAVA